MTAGSIYGNGHRTLHRERREPAATAVRTVRRRAICVGSRRDQPARRGARPEDAGDPEAMERCEHLPGCLPGTAIRRAGQ